MSQVALEKNVYLKFEQYMSKVTVIKVGIKGNSRRIA